MILDPARTAEDQDPAKSRAAYAIDLATWAQPGCDPGPVDISHIDGRSRIVATLQPCVCSRRLIAILSHVCRIVPGGCFTVAIGRVCLETLDGARERSLHFRARALHPCHHPCNRSPGVICRELDRQPARFCLAAAPAIPSPGNQPADFFITYLAIHGLALGSPQRVSGIFAAGSFLGPALIFAAEFMVLLAILAVGVFWLASNQELMTSLAAQMERLQNGSLSPEQVQQLLLPYLNKPVLIFGVGIFAAVIVPLIEELLKPVGVWFLVGKAIKPADGFVAGILCGAGYALIESLGLASSGEAWASLAVARIGTAGIHILTTGLSGWALALAWRQNRYIRLGGVYLFNVFYHGLWNALTLTIVVTSLPRLGNTGIYTQLDGIARVAPTLLVGMAVLAVTGLLAANWYLSKKQGSEIPGDVM